MRSLLLRFSSRYPRTCRRILRILAPVLPHRWVICEMVERCGAGYMPARFRLGNGMKVSGFLGDLVCYHIANNGWYEPEMIEAVRKSLTRDTIFFDIGSHVGQYSLMAAPLCREVHAFEANHRTAKALKANIESNVLKNVTVNECAVCDHVGTATFHEAPGYNPGASSLSGDGISIEVPMTTLDEYCKKLDLKNHPIVLKIDVEGAELGVLRGAANLLRSPNVKIFAELIEQLQQRNGSSREHVLYYLQNLNYETQTFDDKNIIASVQPITV